MFEIFKAMVNDRVKRGRKIYHLYDCSGSEIIERSKHMLERRGHSTLTVDQGNGWIALYCNPKLRVLV